MLYKGKLIDKFIEKMYHVMWSPALSYVSHMTHEMYLIVDGSELHLFSLFNVYSFDVFSFI